MSKKVVKKKALKRRKTNSDGELYSSKYPWLSDREADLLLNGGYYDSEGVLHNSEGCVRCTSAIKSTGKRCKNFARPGETTCFFHGGVRGRKASGKMRVYSAFIEDPTVANIYESTRDSAQVFAIQEELCLLRGLLGKLLQNGEDMSVKEVKEISTIIGEIRQLIGDCTKAEIRLGKLVDIEAVKTMVAKLVSIIARYVTDEELLRKIADECESITIPNALATTTQPEREEPVRCLPE